MTPVAPGDELPDGDYMTWTCGEPIGPGLECNTVTQGGRRGLELHRRVVHPD
jgi:hypothetical protein